MSKILTVFGATGNQGGSVVRAVLADPVLSKEFKVRAVTRNASSPAAKALADLGAEIVVADMSTPEQAAPAVKDAHTVFLVTNFWEGFSAAVEVAQGKAVTDAAKAAGVEHMVFSTLRGVTELTKGRFTHVEHFDGKAEVEKYIRASGVPATFFIAGYFMSNLLSMGGIRIYEEAGELRVKVPMGTATAQMPLFDVRDTGKYVKVAIKQFPKLVNTHIYAAVDYYTPDRVMAELSAVTGKPARAIQVSDEDFLAAFPYANVGMDILENQKLMDCEGYFGGASLDSSLALLEDKLTSWGEWVDEHKDQFGRSSA